MKKKATLIASLLILAQLAACGETTVDPTVTTAGSGDSTEAPRKPARLLCPKVSILAERKSRFSTGLSRASAPTSRMVKSSMTRSMTVTAPLKTVSESSSRIFRARTPGIPEWNTSTQSVRASWQAMIPLILSADSTRPCRRLYLTEFS